MEILPESTSNSSTVDVPVLRTSKYSIYTVKRSSQNQRYKRRRCSLTPAESDSLPHAHAQTTKTYYWHQDSRIKKAQKSFHDDATYEHVGKHTRSQEGKDDQDKQGKDLKISKLKTNSKDNDKSSRSKITKHEGTSLQQDKDQDKDSRTQTQSNLIKVHGRIIQDLTSENSKTTHWGRLLASKYICEHGSSESAGNLPSREIVSLKILSQTKKLGY
ncbi:hypothetical protein Tco_0087187 [Tanacetum coccineum]